MHLYGCIDTNIKQIALLSSCNKLQTTNKQCQMVPLLIAARSHYYKKIRNLTDFSLAVVKLEYISQLAGIASRKKKEHPYLLIS